MGTPEPMGCARCVIRTIYKDRTTVAELVPQPHPGSARWGSPWPRLARTAASWCWHQRRPRPLAPWSPAAVSYPARICYHKRPLHILKRTTQRGTRQGRERTIYRRRCQKTQSGVLQRARNRPPIDPSRRRTAVRCAARKWASQASTAAAEICSAGSTGTRTCTAAPLTTRPTPPRESGRTTPSSSERKSRRSENVCPTPPRLNSSRRSQQYPSPLPAL